MTTWSPDIGAGSVRSRTVEQTLAYRARAEDFKALVAKILIEFQKNKSGVQRAPGEFQLTNSRDHFAVRWTNSDRPYYQFYADAASNRCHCTPQFFKYLELILTKVEFEHATSEVLNASMPSNLRSPAEFIYADTAFPFGPQSEGPAPLIPATGDPDSSIAPFAINPQGETDHVLYSVFRLGPETPKVFFNRLFANFALQINVHLLKDQDRIDYMRAIATDPTAGIVYYRPNSSTRLDLWVREGTGSGREQGKCLLILNKRTGKCKYRPAFLTYLGKVVSRPEFNRFVEYAELVDGRGKENKGDKKTAAAD